MKPYKLNTLGSFKNGLNFAKQTVNLGCKMVGVADFGDRMFPDCSSLSEIDEDLVKPEYLLKEGDILFVRSNGNKDLVGRSLLINEVCENVTFSGFCIRFRLDTTLVLPMYLLYLLKSPSYRKQFSTTQQTNINNLNQEILGNLVIHLPDKQKQFQIVECLSAIDRKIQVNSRIIVELEAMAQAIYNYWFVQFDFPDENGKPYRSSGREMVWNEEIKREIPKGWRAGKLADIANITMGQSPQGDSYNENKDGMVFFQGCTDFGYRFPKTRVYTNQPSRIAEQGDVLLSVRAPVGTINIAAVQCCIGRGIAALHSKCGANSYLLCLMQGLKPIFDVINGNGTTFGAVTKDMLFDIKVCIPRNEVIIAFEEITTKMNENIFNREMEIRELTKLRNWLLPMLMNGQVSVE